MKRNLILAALLTAFAWQLQAQNEPWHDASLSPEERARDLVSRMTLEEKISQMSNASPAIERLGIPAYEWWNEALHGVARAGLATVFPQPIGLAATFDEAAVGESFTMISDEARAKHHRFVSEGQRKRYQGLTFWTPNINIYRDPRWGRGMETYGEDPCLTAKMGLAVVRGLQGDRSGRYDKTHACAKHFAVHSGPEWNRHSFNAKNIADRDLWETYLPAFKALVVEGDVREVMCAYNRYEGKPCCGSDQLLIRILREEWGYDGLVVSDCGAIRDFHRKGDHETHRSAVEASADAVLTGTDLECGSEYLALRKAVSRGLIDEAALDESLVRLMKARFELGLFDPDSEVPWAQIPYSVVACEAHGRKALEMARKSMVLLRNNGVLPLAAGVRKIAVVGVNAADSAMLWGNYNGFPQRTVTILEGLRNALPDTEIRYEEGAPLVDDPEGRTRFGAAEAAAVAQRVADCEVIIYVGGLSPKLEGEEMKVNYPGFRGGDRTSIRLPEAQRTLIGALDATGRPVVFVNCSGSAIALAEVEPHCDAILQAWYAGQAGGTAVADVLTGRYNPAGRLPVTFYASDDDLPDFEDYRMQGRTYRYFDGRALYPFGHGLSYTTFAYGAAQLSRNTLTTKEVMEVSIPLTNSGARDGEEVIQLYLRRKNDPEGPRKALRAWRRVALAAGETRTEIFRLTTADLEWYDPSVQRMGVVKGDYELLYGGSSDDAALQQVGFTIE